MRLNFKLMTDDSWSKLVSLDVMNDIPDATTAVVLESVSKRGI